MTESVTHETVRDAILFLALERGPEKTICPSEAARLIGGSEWRRAMPTVRAVVAELVKEQRILATQQGRPVDPLEVHGPIRIGLASAGG